MYSYTCHMCQHDHRQLASYLYKRSLASTIFNKNPAKVLVLSCFETLFLDNNGDVVCLLLSSGNNFACNKHHSLDLQVEEPNIQWKSTSWLHGLPIDWGDLAVSHSKQVTRHPKFYQEENQKVSRKQPSLFIYFSH